ncbi:MAG: hypothetical protein ACI83D_000400 [Planctomycetota bacterium]|jgi:hypothetical protein
MFYYGESGNTPVVQNCFFVSLFIQLFINQNVFHTLLPGAYLRGGIIER